MIPASADGIVAAEKADMPEFRLTQISDTHLARHIGC
jgi:hypothetical protein